MSQIPELDDNTVYNIADLIREQAMAMNMSAANAYDAGLQEGFRRGIARAAELAQDQLDDNDLWLVHAIRALRLKP